MNIEELVPGDVIVFTNYYPVDNYDYVDHIAIFAGYNRSTGLPEIIHSVLGAEGHYSPSKPSGLCKTTLRALKNQIQHEQGHCDRLYHVKFSVFRCKNPRIANKAFNILERQSALLVPYDEKRLNEKFRLEDEESFEAKDFLQFSEERYRSHGVYRSVKFAARYLYPLTRTRMDGVGRGLTCSMAAVLAFQIAELLIDKMVTPLLPLYDDEKQWVSDLYAPTPTSEKTSPEFLLYLDSLKKDRSIVTNTTYITGYECWKSDKISPEEYQHTTFRLDSKVIGAAGLELYMQSNSNDWKNLGELHVAERTFTKEEKKINSVSRNKAFELSVATVIKVVQESPSFVSPTKSPSPLPEQPTEMDPRLGRILSMSSFSSSGHLFWVEALNDSSSHLCSNSH